MSRKVNTKEAHSEQDRSDAATPMPHTCSMNHPPVRPTCGCGGAFSSPGHRASGDAPTTGYAFQQPRGAPRRPSYATGLRTPRSNPTESFIQTNVRLPAGLFIGGNCFEGATPRHAPQSTVGTRASLGRPQGASSGGRPTGGLESSRGGGRRCPRGAAGGASDGVERVRTVMPIRFVQSTDGEGGLTFQLFCSNENLEKLRRFLSEAEYHGRGRVLDGYLCPVDPFLDEGI